MKQITFISILLSTLCFGCGEKEDEKLYQFEASCENKIILETFENEQGFLRMAGDPLIDRVFYYFFEPVTPLNEFSERLLFWYHSGEHWDADLEKYANEIITVSGNVTNCLYLIRQQHPDGDYGLVTNEYNMLELSSIKEVKK